MSALEPATPDERERRRVPCELLGDRVAVPYRPERIVSLVAGFTEALFALGLAERVVGVSAYCGRYVDIGRRVVVGNYLQVDEERLAALRPDLVLMTSGVQLGVARRLAAHGWPVVVLPVPDGFAAILANIRRLGALAGSLAAARRLADRLMTEAVELQAAVRRGPTVYAELWFGRHARAAGGFGFVHDLLELAGGRNVLADEPEGFCPLDLERVPRLQPQVVLIFWEEDDHRVDVPRLLAERGWSGSWPFEVLEAGIQRGRNLIHDGPSYIETARWLRTQWARAADAVGADDGYTG